jgi:catechol 2,3-dioxygenase-like lactoylglutathione lyase family enzyme
VTRLAGVVVGVPDPAATAAFLRDALSFAVDGATAYCEGDYGRRGQSAIELREAEALELVEIVFELDDERDPLDDPAGNHLVFLHTSARKRDPPPYDPLRPRRLGHVNLKAPDPPATAAFYADVLGLRLSEQIGENLYFLRIGSEHHNVALRPGPRGELHHLGFEVSGWQVYQPILDRLADLGLGVEYGPGRHGPGRNLFTYVCDPSSGLRVELFADMAQIPDEASYEPIRWEAGDRLTKTINRWGPTPPASFLE